jgi:hypothetical protein
MSRVVRYPATVCLLVLAFLLGLPGQNPGAQETPFISVERIDGAVDVLRSGKDAWTKLEVGQAVNRGDTIRTAVASSVDLKFKGGMIRLSKETLLEIPTQGNLDELRVTRLEKGEGIFEVEREEGLERRFEVETPSLVASIQGTRFRVTQTEELGCVKVDEGEVQVTDETRDVATRIIVGLGEGLFEKVCVRKGGKPETVAEELEVEEVAEVTTSEFRRTSLEVGDGFRQAVFEASRDLRAAIREITQEIIQETLRDVIREASTGGAGGNGGPVGGGGGGGPAGAGGGGDGGGGVVGGGDGVITPGDGNGDGNGGGCVGRVGSGRNCRGRGIDRGQAGRPPLGRPLGNPHNQ